MKNNKSYVIFYVILLILIGICIFYYYNKNKSTKIPQSTQTISQSTPSTVASVTEAKKNELNYSGTIYYTNVADNIYNIYAKTSTSDQKLIFTDKDENEKIIYTPGMSNNNTIIAVMASPDQTFGGTLYSLSTDGSGQKTKLIDKFSTSQAPSISQDGTKIAYIHFSNAEFEYGFSLYVSDLNGKNQTKIDTDPSSISNFIFNTDSSAILYLKNNKIYSTTIDGKNTTVLYELNNDDKLTGLSCNIKPSDVLVTLQNKIIKLSTESKNTEKLFESNDTLSNAYYISNDEDKIAYIANNIINIIDLKNQSLSGNNATNIIEWIK